MLDACLLVNSCQTQREAVDNRLQMAARVTVCCYAASLVAVSTNVALLMISAVACDAVSLDEMSLMFGTILVPSSSGSLSRATLFTFILIF